MNLTTIIILLLLVCSFYLHYTNHLNISTLFEKTEEFKKLIPK